MASCIKKIPPEIADTENLGRELHQKGHAKRNIPWYAFQKADDNKGLSINRMDFADTATMAEIGKKNAKKRGSTFRGWATLPASKATQEDRKLEYSPEPDNPYHCDLILPSRDPSIDSKTHEKTHAQNLADASELKKYIDQDQEELTQLT